MNQSWPSFALLACVKHALQQGRRLISFQPEGAPLSFDEVSPALRALLDPLEELENPAGFEHSAPCILQIRLPLQKSYDHFPMHWLMQQMHEVKIYWSNREKTQTWAAVGVADMHQACESKARAGCWESLHQVLRDAPPTFRYFGGSRFAQADAFAPQWQAFGDSLWVLPQIAISVDHGTTMFQAHLVWRPGESMAQAIEQLFEAIESMEYLQHPVPSFAGLKQPCPREDRPHFEGWSSMLKQLQLEFAMQTLHKVVLARETEIPLADLEPIAWLPWLAQQTQDTFLYYFQCEAGRAFLGASPERFYRRDGQTMYTEALAGTRPRGRDFTSDEELGQELLHSDKDRVEQRFVYDALEQSMAQLCAVVDGEKEPILRKLRTVQHLCSPMIGLLKPETSDVDVLGTLHPTPAVGGAPRELALEILKALEPFDRGWYAAPIGWMSCEQADFCVAIRCALFAPERLYLYTGAGIVSASQAPSEWQELEYKLQPFLPIRTERRTTTEEVDVRSQLAQ